MVGLSDQFARHVLTPQAGGEGEIADVEAVAHEVVVGQRPDGRLPVTGVEVARPYRGAGRAQGGGDGGRFRQALPDQQP